MMEITVGISRDRLEKIVMFSALFIISTTVLTTFPVAFADNIQDSITDGSTKPLLTTETFTTDYFVTSSSNTGNNDPEGCNITLGSDPLELTITVNPPGIVNVSPNPVIITDCKPPGRNSFPVTFSSAQGGTFQISVSGITPVFDQNNIQTGWLFTDSDDYTYSINPNFTLEFIVPDTTPPEITYVITGTLGNNDWYTSNVSVDWTVVDPESPFTIDEGCVDTDITEDTSGITLTCTATSTGGTSSESVTIKRDATPPTIAPPPNVTFAAFGTTGLATVTYDAAEFFDNLSGVATSSSTPASGSSLSVGLNVITHTATDNAGNTASATSTANVFDVIIDNSLINQGSEVNVRIKDQANEDTSANPPDGTVTFNVRSLYGDADAQAGIDVVATAQLPGTTPFSYTFANGVGSLVVTSEPTDELTGKLNIGNGGYDTITVKYTTGEVTKEVTADTLLAGGGGRPATALDPFKWSSDRYLTETTGTVMVFEQTLKNNGISDTRPASVFSSTDATVRPITLYENAGDTGQFTSAAIAFSTLASSFNDNVDGGANNGAADDSFRLNAPATATVTAQYAPLSGSLPNVVATIDGLTIPFFGSIPVPTPAANCASFGGDTDNDAICNNWETQSALVAGIKINQISSPVYSYACRPQIDDTAGNPAGSRYSVHNSSPSFVTTDTTSYGCPNPNQRDVYIEWDYMTGHKPSRDAIAKVIDVLATAPDPDGVGPILPGIKAHFQLDESYGFHRDQITFNKAPPTLSENYDLVGSWTQTGTQVTVDASNSNTANFAAALDTSDRRVQKSLGLTLDSTRWKMESQFNPTAAITPNHFIYVLQAGAANPDTTTSDRIGVAYKVVSSVNKLMLFKADGTATETFTSGITAPIGSTYYINLERISATNVKLSVFSDEQRTTHVTGSPQSLAITSGISGLNTLIHSIASSGVDTASLTASIDNTSIYNGFNPGFQDLKLAYFGKSTERNQAGQTESYISNYLANKRQVFHYGGSLHDLVGRVCTSGLAEIGGNDLTTSLGCFAQNVGSVDEQAGTILHELGHNWNLNHGGGSTDENIGKPNYLSVMNYAFQFTYPTSDASYTRPLDFSRSALPSLDGRSLASGGSGLSETIGIGPAPQSPVVTVGSPGSPLVTTLTSWKSLYGPESLPGGAITTGVLSSGSNNPIDWDRDSTPGEVVYGIAIHNMPSVGASDSTPRLLEGFNDYTGIDFNFRDSSFYGDGFTGYVDEGGATFAAFTSDVPHDTPFAKKMAAPLDAFAKNTSQQIAALLEDPDGCNAPSCVTESYTYSWNKGDGTTIPGTINNYPTNPYVPADAVPGDETRDGDISDSLSYSSQGRYSLTLTVSDSDTPTTHSSETEFPDYMMVIDSSIRNRVSSSSAFNSPPNAVRSPTGNNDDTAGTVGPVTTTFSAQYKNGAVSGSFGFNLKATDGNSLELKNAKLNWVVIVNPTTGAGAAPGTLEAHAKGTASITGRTGTFGFLVSVVDMNPAGGSGTDTIRVRIWDPTIGDEHDINAIIYDNMCLDPDGSITGIVSCSRLYSSATTPVTSGTISIT